MPKKIDATSIDAQILTTLQQVVAATGLLRNVPADIRDIQAELKLLARDIRDLRRTQSPSTPVKRK